MAKAFKCDGFWWLPDSPADRVAGTLRCDSRSRIALDLFGTLPGADEARESGYRLMLGEADETPVGTKITLTDCRVSGESFSQPGLHRQKFSPRELFGGEHLVAEEDFHFNSCSLGFSGLPFWASELTGLGRMGADPFSISWAHPTPIRGKVPAADFGIGVSGNIRNRQRIRSIRERVTFSLSLAAPLTVREINASFAYPLQNFFTLACDAPNAITRWELGQGTSPRNVHYVAPRTISPRDVAKTALFSQLFNLGDVREKLSDVLGSWVRLHLEVADSCNLYFGMQYAKSTPYLDLQFQTIIQALTLYAQRRGLSRSPLALSGLASLWEKATKGEQELLARLLDDSPLLAAETALGPLLEKHGHALSPLAGDGAAFTATVLETLRYVTQRKPDSAAAATRGTSLYVLIQQCSWLMKLCFLDELGFSPEKRAEIVMRHPASRHLADMSREE